METATLRGPELRFGSTPISHAAVQTRPFRAAAAAAAGMLEVNRAWGNDDSSAYRGLASAIER